MSNIRRYKGFSAVEVILIVAVVALIGFLGWTFYQAVTKQDSASDNSSKQETTGTAAQDIGQGQDDTSPAVEDTSDLDDAEEYLNKTDVDKDLDTGEIDSALDS